MHTPEATDLIENINKNINYTLFKEVLHFELPFRPLGVNRKKCKNLYENLTDTIYTLNKKNKIQKIFLCNTDNFYIYYEHVAKEIGANIILLEEGLTTYRMFAKNRGRNFTFRDLQSEFKRLIKNLKKVIVTFTVLILKTLSWIFKFNIFYFVKHHRIPKKYRYGNINYFSKAYVCFPDKMKTLTTNQQIGEINKLNFFVNSEIEQKSIDKLENNMTLFVNQKYISYRKHFKIVFEILKKNGIEKIYIKFHPKESRIQYFPHLKKAMDEYPDIEIKVLEGLEHIPAEDLLTTGKINKIIGITTSTLIYGKLICPQLKVVSIADSYKELCLSHDYNVDAKEMDLFMRDYQAFKEVFDIKQI
jgi:hypothetical protein